MTVAAHWRAGLLVLAVGLIWCAHHDRWTLAAWQLPTEYGGDVPEVLTGIKAASEGDIRLLQPKVIGRLGAPFGAHWNAYPTPDKPLLNLLGGLVGWIGLFAAANLGLLFALISAALAFYFVARWLRCRWEWAWAGALLFAFTYQTFHRGLGHFSLTLSWTIPLGLLSVWLVARSRRLEWRSVEAGVCLGSAVALGMGNPYYLLFWLQLMGWALIAQYIDRRRRANLAIGTAALVLAGGVFFASHAEVWLHVNEPAAQPLLSRNYGGTEIYALKPLEMLIPPTAHRWDAMAFLGQRYERWSLLRGESFPPYLGIFGIAGLLWLGAVTARNVFTRRTVPGHALSVGWLVSYATMGGLTNLLALIVGFHVFRATNRVGVYISALVLFFLVVRLSRLTGRWPASGRLAAALGVAALGVLDQMPRPPTAAQQAEMAAEVRSDEKLGRDLEAALPAGAMVFQLPVMGFPEEPPPHRLSDYELFRPYLMTKSLGFSYGAAKFRSRSRWQRDLENAAPKSLIRQLEAYGFAALYVNRRGYADRAEGLLAELRSLGYERQIASENGEQVVLLLEPRPYPVPPLGRSLTLGRAWQTRQSDGVRWAYDDAVVSYFNPYAEPLAVELALTLVAVSERELSLEHGGRILRTLRVGTEPAILHLPRLELAPGVNVLTLRSSEPAKRVSTGRNGLRTFGLQDSSLKVHAPFTFLD